MKFILQFVSQIWLARLISPAEYGLVAMVTPILSFTSILSDLGVGMSLIQQRWISQSQISALFWFNAAISLLISLALIALSPLVGLLYHEPKTIPITIALAGLFFANTLGVHPSAILVREMRLARRAVIESAQYVVGITVGILTAIAGCSYWSLIYLQMASTATGLLLIWWSAGWLPSRPRWDPSIKRTLRFGASLTVSNIAVYFSMSADNMIVGAVNGKVALGLYDKAYRLVVAPLSQMSSPIGRVAIPLLSRLDSEPERYASAFKKMMQIPNLICIPGLVCGMFLAPQLVHLFLGPTWGGISPVFSWVCVGGLGSCIYGSAYWLFTSQGRGREQMKWAIVTSAISVLSFVIGIRWGAVGVASLAGVGFAFVQTPLIMWAATTKGPVSGKHVIDAIVPLAVSLVITAPLVYLYSKVTHLGELSKICLGVALAYGCYLSIMSLLPSGRELLSGSITLISNYVNRLRAKHHSVPA